MPDRSSYKSHEVVIDGTHKLHLAEWNQGQGNHVVLCLHGMMENGRIFYTPSGKKGLVPYLIQHRWRAFVPDFRGQGLSSPKINRSSRFGHMDIINTDLSKIFDAVFSISQADQVHCVCHSWGGVLLFSFLVRYPQYAKRVKSVVLFGTKRRISTQHLQKWIYIDLVWNRLARLVARVYGYLPAPLLRMGAEPEALACYEESITWVKSKAWKDTRDGFDYGLAAKSAQLPPTLSVAAVADPVLGNPRDAADFCAELGGQAQHIVLAKKHGNLHDYDHITMLTHPEAANDHFKKVLQFLEQPSLQDVHASK